MRHCQKSFAFARLESSLEALSAHFLPAHRDEIYLLLWELGSNALKYGVRDCSASVRLEQSMGLDSGANICSKICANICVGELQILAQLITPARSLAGASSFAGTRSFAGALAGLRLYFFYKVQLRFSPLPMLSSLTSRLAPRELPPHRAQRARPAFFPPIFALPLSALAFTASSLDPLAALPPAPSTPSPQNSAQHNGLGQRVINHYASIFCYNAPIFFAPCAHIRAISLHIKGSYLAL